MSDLPALLKRLEVVTGRLEDLATKGGISAGVKAAASPASSGESSPSLDAFDEVIAAQLKPLVELSSKIGGLVNDQVKLLNEAINAQRNVLVTASKAKKPDANTLQQILKPVSDLLMKIVELKEKNRPSPLINHLSTIAEGIPALGWLAVEPKPAPFIEEMKNAAQFYANKILKEYKEKDKTHVEWVNAFIGFLTELQGFVKKYHTTGLVWNANGADAKGFISDTPAPAPSSAPVASTPAASAASSAVQAKAALFSELSKGTDVTSGLKKVDRSQMTHKNPALRASSVVKAAESAAGPEPSGRAAATTKGPAKVALEGNRWVVENHDNNKNIVLDQVEAKQAVYIGSCVNSTIQIKGKINTVILDSCKKTAVVVDSLVSAFEIVNCKSIQAQIIGKAPTMSIEKTDGCLVYLSKDCLDIEIFTSKSSELNVSIPGKTPQDDFVEKAIAEQFKTVIQGETLVTVPVEHKG